MHAQPLQGLLEPKLLNPEFYAQLITSNNPVTAPALDKSGNPINSFKGKSLAIMDPLYPDNNLGRSVNRASYFRMRKALRHGYITLSQAAAVVRTAGPAPATCTALPAAARQSHAGRSACVWIVW